MKIAILGFGREGKSIYKFLRLNPAYQKSKIWILDENVKTKAPAGVKKQFGKNYLKNLDRFDFIFRSPGVAYNKVIERQAKLTSATRLFFTKCPCPIIGITGTKGKGTTATLLYNIIKACGRDVYLAGNIGLPALDVLPALKKDSAIILELSSFQLQDLDKSPPIALILDIFPDHQDHHRNFKEYIDAKSNIARHQNNNDKVFYFSDDKYSSWAAKKSRGIKRSVYYRLTKKERLVLRETVKIPGAHNWRNVQAAFAIAKDLGCSVKKILKAVSEYKGMEHRLEKVTLRQAQGRNKPLVYFYNDSASTNPQTTLAAVKSFKQPKVLIAGGKDKGLDYKIWANEFPKNNIKAVILFGENKGKINATLRQAQGKFETNIVSNLKEAVNSAFNLARQNLTKSDFVILFSPGAASFDMFKDYAERGQKFKKLVKSL